MTNVAHDALTGSDLHMPGYVQSSDPGAVGAGKLWVDMSAGPGKWAVKFRNAANTAWELIATNSGASMPPGAIAPYSGSTAPTGWLLCDGSAVSRTSYADLFSAIFTTYGSGDGSTTFNVPDLRGRFPLGKDNMGGTSANRVAAAQADVLGGSGGEEMHTLTVPEIPPHSHTPQHGGTG